MQSITILRLTLLGFMHLMVAIATASQPPTVQQPHVYPTTREVANDILPTLSYTLGGRR